MIGLPNTFETLSDNVGCDRMGLYDSIDNKFRNYRSKRDEVAKIDEIRVEMQEINEEIREQIYLIGQYYWQRYYDGEYAPGDDLEFFEAIDRCNAKLKYLSKKADECKVVGLVERESIDEATNLRIKTRMDAAEARRKQRAEEKERNRIERERIREENEERRRIEKAEHDRIAAEKAAERAAEKQRLAEQRAVEKAEHDRLAAERAAERAEERERRAAERAAEKARIAAEKAEKAKAEAEALRVSEDSPKE